MRRKTIWVLSCALFSLFWVGCASRKEITQFKDDMLYVRLRLDALQSENRKMMELLRDLNKSLVDLQEESRRTKADMISEMTALRDQTQYLQGMLDDTGDRMSKLIHRVEDKASSKPKPDSLEALLLPGVDVSKRAGEGDLEPKTLYDAAYLDLTRGDYDLALRGFREYLKVFPKTEYSDNAQYWIGEIFYADGAFEKALAEFQKVDTDYPNGDKVAAALLKMGYCQIQLNQSARAREYLNRVIARFPNSVEANLAKSKLKEL
ncbi:MAG: tol-pal system protein YbgF [bacterium]